MDVDRCPVCKENVAEYPVLVPTDDPENAFGTVKVLWCLECAFGKPSKTDWIMDAPLTSDKPLTLEDLKRIQKLSTVGPAKPSPFCRVCGRPNAVWIVPKDGFYCDEHLPDDVEPTEFPS